MNDTSETIIRTAGSVGRITLNRPQALNALTLNMVEAMTKALLAWRDDPTVRAVVVDGTGEKGFCAGGDIRMLHDSGKAGDDQAETFWREEYKLNQLIKRYPKPYVALIDGITMGGGVGISVHGSHRVAGDRTMMAMPETGIGFFPDVGGTYFLPRLPGAIGMWLGLTGARLKSADTLAVGIATHFVPSDRTADLIAALEAAELDDAGGAVEATIAAFEGDPGDAPIASQRADIDRLFAGDSVADILEALKTDGSEWASKQLSTLANKSPTSLKLTFRALTEGASLEFEDALRRELGLSVAGLAEGSDFYEGVRAVIIDKDNAPAWRPAMLTDVTDESIDALFAPDRTRPIEFLT